MRFMMIYRGVERNAPPSEKEMADMGAFIQELAQSGKLLLTDGLKPSATGAKVRLDRGKHTVTDGPFTEAKEVIGGFAIMRLDTMEEAVALAKRFLTIAGDGESEIREMYDEPAYAA